MKSTSFSIFFATIAVSHAEAFANTGRKFVSSTAQLQPINDPFSVRGGAQTFLKRKKSKSRYTTFSEISASVAGGDSSSKDETNILQSVASAPLTKAILSSTLFVFTDMLIKNLFKAKGISFPSSLGGCCFLAATLLAAPFHQKLYRILNPGAKLMQKFMMVFLVPNLIILPLCGGNYSALEVSKSRDGVRELRYQCIMEVINALPRSLMMPVLLFKTNAKCLQLFEPIVVYRAVVISSFS